MQESGEGPPIPCRDRCEQTIPSGEIAAVDDFSLAITCEVKLRLKVIEASLHALEADLKFKALIASAGSKTEDLSASIDASSRFLPPCSTPLRKIL